MKPKILSAAALIVISLALMFVNAAFGYVEYKYGTITALAKRDGPRMNVLSLSIPAGVTSNSNLVLIVSGKEFKLSGITITTLTDRLPSFKYSISGNESVVEGFADGILFLFQFFKGSLVSTKLTFDSRFRGGKSDSKEEISLGVKGRGFLTFDVDAKMLEELLGKPTETRRRILVDF